MQTAPRPQAAVLPVDVPSVLDLRAGVAGDAAFISWALRTAGAGLYEQMLDGVVPGFDVETLLGLGIADPKGPFSVANAVIAFDGEVRCGMALAHPRAEALVPAELARLVPAERLAPLRPLLEPVDDGSLYVLGLTVLPDYSRQGVATTLLRAVGERARSAGLARVTLHAWADNEPAIALYRSCGFMEQESQDLPASAWLRSAGPLALLEVSADHLCGLTRADGQP